MRFGETLQQSIYPPWREQYINYTKLKQLLHEDGGGNGTEGQAEWTEHDESVFVEELINVQLEKVHSFQRKMSQDLHEWTTNCEEQLHSFVADGAAATPDKAEQNGEQGEGGKTARLHVLKKVTKELDDITRDINELERFSRINFTGFLKAAKKHDRKPRGMGGKGKGKGKTVVVKPLLQVRLSHLEFNKEDYSPLLYRLSTMYEFVRRYLGKDNAETAEVTGSNQSNKKYTSHKFWVHPDNAIEVKTFVLRHLPVLVYNPQPSTETKSSGHDPTITSLYFDNEKFELYTDKVLKKKDATSLRLRWYGPLSKASEIFLERKTMHRAGDDAEGAAEERIALKEKYVNDFIEGNYSMEKTIQKIKDRKTNDEVEKYQSLVGGLQRFIQDNDLQPVLRASYTRSAFQIPGDDRLRISLDMDLALIREDALDSDRPCRDSDNWHRRDIDDSGMEYPFSGLRKGEIVRFPYALLEIKVRDREREWVRELMASHLVHGAPRFSKFVHGVSVLFEDYVNSFPFWLSDLEEDIRKDPRKVWEVEQARKKKQIEDETVAGSFRAAIRDFGDREIPAESLFVPHTEASDSIPRVRPQKAESKMLPSEPAVLEEEGESNDALNLPHRGGASAVENLRQLFPSFSSSRYGQAHSRGDVVLPAGIHKPNNLLMYAGEVKVESKVWLANQRTFIKWMHITVLLATLGVGLYNGAGPENHIARGISLAYTAIAVFAGAWGWAMYMWRSRLIRERSGKDFDHVFGPIVVCIAVAVALVVNFVFKYRAAMGNSSGYTLMIAPDVMDSLIEQALESEL